LSGIKRTVLIAVAVLGSALTAWSQVRDRELQDKLESQLDALSRDMAREYLDILESLQDVIEDYSDYMTESTTDAAAHRVDGVERIQRKLKEKAYVDNPELLLEDLNAAINDIKAVENAHRVKFNTNSPSCCRLGRSLRKELVIISELVEDYSEKQGDRLLNRDESRVYLEAALEYLAALSEAKKSAKMTDEVRQALEALKDLGLEDYIVLAPDAAEAPEPPEPVDPLESIEIPDPPAPPLVIVKPPKGWVSGRRGAEHQANGVLTVSNSSLPIVIENPSGDVIISGSSGRTVTANLHLEVAAATHDKEEEYIQRVRLEMAEESDQYTVRIELPRLSDHRTELISCQLEVSVPQKNPIDCRASYGEVSISSVSGPVTVAGSTSQVTVERASGGVSVTNSMGAVELSEVSGDIEVRNSYAPINILSCNGAMLLKNQYGPITLSASEGRLRIDNTGQVEITDHTGDITIENLYGAVDAQNIEGDIVATNGYQPITVRDVSGSAELENQYAEISARQVGGNVSITNQYAPIFVEALEGPVDLTNYYSNISIDLVRGFRGGSTIANTQGTTTVTVVQQPNLVLSVFTEGGNISSSLPMTVRSRGNTKSGELVLGDGGDQLEVTATGGSIIIRGR
jgi:DUF4097 and DUF4098 domain-containing protein YvlB